MQRPNKLVVEYVPVVVAASLSPTCENKRLPKPYVITNVGEPVVTKE
jgi:hypothetical protein